MLLVAKERLEYCQTTTSCSGENRVFEFESLE